MQTMLPSLIVAAVVVAPVALGEDATKPMPAHAEAVFINAADLAWADGPPDFPKGLKITVLHGDPAKSAPFTLRVKLPDGYRIPGHWHSQDEQLTIMAATLLLHMGDDYDAPSHSLTAGAYHFLPGKMHHAAEAKGETIVQVDGTGPFDIHYLKPTDDPRQATK